MRHPAHAFWQLVAAFRKGKSSEAWSICSLGPYKASLLKAFQRTVEEARFTFVIVDANNLRFEDFKTYWSAGQVRHLQSAQVPVCVGSCLLVALALQRVLITSRRHIRWCVPSGFLTVVTCNAESGL